MRRQIGKSYLIRYVGRKLFPNFIEINLKEDLEGERVFADVHTTDDLYMRLSNFYSSPLGDKTDTLVFLDEIQSYPHLISRSFCGLQASGGIGWKTSVSTFSQKRHWMKVHIISC